jgi:16S rRNA (uracil1498-N3)-methyltransferase
LERLPRFHHPGSLDGGTLQLEGDEARHAAARRLRRGAAVEIFDGKGAARQGVIEDRSRDRVVIRFSAPAAIDPLPPRELVLALSPPKGDRMAFAVEKLSELGCRSIVPVIFRRGEDAGVRAGTGKIEKWRRRAIEAAKQCGRNRLLEIADPLPLADALALWQSGEKLILLEPDAPERLGERLEEARSAATIVIVVGPEGGLADEERRAIVAAGGLPARLFEHVLRIETAAAAAAALYGDRAS